MPYLKHFIISLTILLFTTCEPKDDCNTPAPITPASLESEYGCVNTPYETTIDLDDTHMIIRSQDVFDTMVTGSCTPDIDFTGFDLIIGRQQLNSGVEQIDYYYVNNGCNDQNYLNVQFIRNATTVAPILTYHALVPKLAPDETVTVTVEIL